MDSSWLVTCSLVGATSVGVGVGTLLVLKLLRRKPCCPCEDHMDGKTVIITGANSGIGKATAQELAIRGARIIMACRDVEKGEAAAADIRRHTQGGHLVVKQLDMASLKSIHEFVDDVVHAEPRVDVLVNNAGVYGCPTGQTEDGFDMVMGVNYLGLFALTLLLAEKLAANPPGRMVAVSSGLAKNGVIDLDNLNAHSPKQYSNSKLAVNLFCRELAVRLKPRDVSVHSVHPGMVYTGLGRHVHIPWLLRPLAMFMFWMLTRTPWEGAQPVVYCTVAPELSEVTGRCYGYCKEEPWKEVFMDDEMARRLWDMSEKLTQISLHPLNQ